MIGHRLSWVKLAEALKKDPALVALLPVGSFEQHAHHLPLSTDSMLAWRIASMVEERLPEKTVLLPPIVYGCSAEHRGFVGTVWVDYTVFVEYVVGVVGSLFESGFRNVAAINAHGGNVQALGVAQRRLNLRPEGSGRLYVFNLTDFRDVLGTVFGRSVGVQHAGYTETSMVESVCPECVDHEALRSTATGDFSNASPDVFSVHPTRKVSSSGMVDGWGPFVSGDGSRGGEAILRIVGAIAERLSRL